MEFYFANTDFTKGNPTEIELLDFILTRRNCFPRKFKEKNSFFFFQIIVKHFSESTVKI